MDDIVISVENLSKKYDLGVIGTGTFSKDLNRWWARMRRRPDPYAKIGEVDHGNRLGQTILALDDVSFSVKRGEVLGIIGRNGAGKSTLLKILSQVTAPSSGKVKIKGRIGSLLEVGTGFHPELTGRENLYLNGAILGMSKAEVNRKFDEIVDFSGVEKFIDTPVKRYSSGMYVRLAFAVAAHLEPEILIVDEVLAVGDAEFQKKCLGKMSDVAHEGRTVLFVSHNMPAIASLCNRVICITSGKISLSGEVNTVISQYLADKNKYSCDRVFDNLEETPGNNFANLYRVNIEDKNKKMTSEIFSGDEFTINIEYRNLIEKTRLSTTLLLFNQEGSILFSSISNLEKEWHNKPRPIGNFISSCSIPSNLLSPGTYTIGVIICANNYQDCFREDNLLKFTIIDSGNTRGDYFGGYSGLIQPLLHWSTNIIK